MQTNALDEEIWIQTGFDDLGSRLAVPKALMGHVAVRENATILAEQVTERIGAERVVITETVAELQICQSSPFGIQWVPKKASLDGDWLPPAGSAIVQDGED